MLLDAELIRTRRLDLRLSKRQVAKHLGTSPVVVTGLEDATNHANLPLRTVAALADILAVDVADLLADHTPSEPGSDAAAAGALLANTDTLTPVEAVADALGWKLDRTTAALEDLDTALRAAGMRLHRLHDEVAIRPAADHDRDGLRRLLRRQQARNGLNITQARVLAAALGGELDTQRLGNADQVAYARLRKAGLLTDDGEATEAVAFALKFKQ